MNLPMEWCLDYCTNALKDQLLKRKDANLKKLKKAAKHICDHLTMVIILDDDHPDYQGTFGGIFEADTLTKRKFTLIKTSHGKGHQPLCVHFAPLPTPTMATWLCTSTSSGGAGSASTMPTLISLPSASMSTLMMKGERRRWGRRSAKLGKGRRERVQRSPMVTRMMKYPQTRMVKSLTMRRRAPRTHQTQTNLRKKVVTRRTATMKVTPRLRDPTMKDLAVSAAHHQRQSNESSYLFIALCSPAGTALHSC